MFHGLIFFFLPFPKCWGHCHSGSHGAATTSIQISIEPPRYILLERNWTWENYCCKSWAFYQNQLTLRLWLDAIYMLKNSSLISRLNVLTCTWKLYTQLNLKPETPFVSATCETKHQLPWTQIFSHRSSLATTTRHDIVWRYVFHLIL